MTRALRLVSPLNITGTLYIYRTPHSCTDSSNTPPSRPGSNNQLAETSLSAQYCLILNMSLKLVLLIYYTQVVDSYAPVRTALVVTTVMLLVKYSK